MDHYTKSSSCPTGVEPGDINVKSGSKLRNIISQSFRLLQNKKEEKITIMGSGPTVTKAITCAEIIKRKMKGLHQMNKLFYTTIEDRWDPNESSLDKLQVTRKIPSIRITLSRVPLDSSQPGYQGPGNSKSPVRFRDEDWELAQEEPSAKTSENEFSARLQSKSEKKNKDHGNQFYKQNHKGCSDNDTGRNKQISEKEAREKAMEHPGDHVRKSLKVYAVGGTEENNAGHVENDLKSDSNSRDEELRNFGSQNSVSSENKHHQYRTSKDSHEKGGNHGGYKSKQSPRKKKKAE